MSVPTEADIAYMMAHASDDRRPDYIAANTICLGAAAIAVVLRFLSRRMAKAKIGLDDYTIVVSLLFTAIYVMALMFTVKYGMGRHVIFLKDVKSFAIWALVAETFYNVSIMTTKLSILFLYHRLFPLQWFKRTVLALGIFIVCYSIPQIFGDIFQCVPIRSKWDPTVTATCIDYVRLIIACGVINIVTDFIMLALPLPVLWSLHVSEHRKWVLTFMFVIGGFVCVISIVRLFYAKHVATVDPTWDFVWPSTISGLECCSAILAACIPTYRPLVNKIRHGEAAENTVPRPSKPSTNNSRRFNIPLLNMLSSKRSTNASQTSSRADEYPLYNKLGKGNDVEIRVASGHGHGDLEQGRTASKQEIMVTQTFSAGRE